MKLLKLQLPGSFLIFILLALVPPAGLPAQDASPEILIIFSYDPGDRWSKSVLEGVMEELPAELNVNPHFEYLDTRNIQHPHYLSRFRGLLTEKYLRHKPDLIIACDDAAFLFAVDLRKVFSGKTPLVFCGVNDADPFSWGGEENITGVNEVVDIAGTVNTALRLFPSTGKIAVVSTSTGLGAINLALYHKQRTLFSREIDTIELIDYDAGRLSSLLPHLGSDTIVLRLDNIRNAGGQILSLGDTMNFLSDYSPRPVFTC